MRRRGDPDLASGRRGEDLAHRYLRKAGFTVVARNYRTSTGSGEMDIVAWEGETLVFVEVKTRRTREFGEPERAVDPEKQRRLRRAALDYIQRAGADPGQVRFDVVSIVLGDPPSITLLRDQFNLR
ncbi:MAG: YraN family protein [Bryobacterales bacterium]|nr:YraN family protein [Bryobacterales bacterium]